MRCAPSTRAFTDQPVGEDVLVRVLDHARFAPSGGNRQGWRVIVVRDPALRLALRELYLPHWEAYRPDPGDSPRRRAALEAADRYARTFERAPVHLVVCVELAALAIVDRVLDRPSIAGGASVYPFVQNVLLGLRGEGLGAAFTTLLVPAEPAVRALLAIPDGVILAGHISVGWRDAPWPAALRRHPVDRFAFAERYGEPLRRAT